MKKSYFVGALSAFALLFASCATSNYDIDYKNPEKKSDFADAKTAAEILSKMTVEEKVAQLFVITPEQFDRTDFSEPKTQMSQELSAMISEYPVGGYILFARNIETPAQIREFTKSLKETSAISPIIAVDEEGGRVARLARNENFFLPKFKSMGDVGKTQDFENARGAGQTIGGYLAAFGFTLDFAPVVDVNTNPQNVVIGDRAFGSDQNLVAKMAESFLSGLHSTGVKGCIKHFPGHGDTKGDTHADYVAVTKTWDELQNCEIVPFKENLKNTDCVMVAHVTFTDIDSEYPASLSKNLVSGKLREELGYDGVVLTDALDMGAIEKNFGSGEASVLAFEAGNDILLMPADFQKSYNALLNAVKSGRISESRVDESVLRILKLKGF